MWGIRLPLMLVGGDLGFSNLGVVVVLLLAQVIGTMVVRRKWRQEVAKREEFKRLLVFASQEEARVEFEPASACRYGFVYQYNSSSVPATTEAVSRRVQYQCAVCLSPTTTRCARCKSIRYCSGKCQIIHWRQGHKEECHPFTNNHQIKEVGVGSSKNVTKQEEYKIEDENLLSHSIPCAKPVETLSKGPLISNYLEVPKKKNENGFDCLVEGIGATSTSKSTESLFSVGISASCTSTYSSMDVPTKSSDCSVNSRNSLKTSVCKVDSFEASKPSPYCSFGAENETTGRYNCKELFSYELFVKLYNWNKFELRPCGLTNCGNSCYANAVLQCLLLTPPLTAYFIQGFHSKACKKKEWCFTCELESLVLKSKEGNSPLYPIQILSHISNGGSQLHNGREEDAHEFLRYAIDTMQSVCLKEAGVHAPGIVEEETTLMGLTFGGYLRSKVRCLKCWGKSERHERMMDLTVEVEGDIGTLEEALHQFTNTETLDGENKFHCSRCKSHEKAKKKLTVLEAPNVLIIALKRFQSGKFGKLNKSIRFPEILDMAPFTSRASDKSPIYRLYGVVVHLDVMNAAFTGHYVCYVRNIQNKWFKIDDSVVKAVELRTVLEEGAYMLLYSRCSPRAPKLIRNSMIPRDPRNTTNSIYAPISHQSGPCDVSIPDSLNCQTASECFTNNHASFLRTKSTSEDTLSDNSTSLFSESCSSSTDSSNKNSTSTEDNFDQTHGDLGHNWSSWDSDTSSSSSSSSPMYLRCSQVSNSHPYFSRHSHTSG